MRIALFDPFSGASGDMILGALLDAGLSLPALRSELTKIDISGYELRVERVVQHGITGTRAIVSLTEDGTSRDWAAIRDLLSTSVLDEPVKGAALAVFQRLAEAEAKVHGAAVEQVHFHEVGGIDAIVDIAGACIGLGLLGVDQIFCGPPRLGSGFASSQHGLIPIPAPATAELLARAGVATAGPDPGTEAVEAELLTPTGAAILTTLAEFKRPDFSPTAIGYGFGQKELPWPNALRVWLGERVDLDHEGDGAVVLETNIDDMNPQFYEPMVERLFAAGALDVWLTPIIMKKGRPATQVSVLALAAHRMRLENILIEQSTTLGVRGSQVDRVKAARRVEAVVTRWGDIRIKLRVWQGRVIDAMPEYDDCRAIATANDLPIRLVWNEAHQLGQSHVGRRLGDQLADRHQP